MKIRTPQEVNEFWFSDEVRPLWFNATPEFDFELAGLFMATYEAATYGQLHEWQGYADGALALVIVLDQFPLNIFRGQVQSFATAEESRLVARNAIENGFDQQLPNERKAFMYLPFMHSEDIQDQDYGVQLYRAAGLHENLKYAEHHREIIRRFGRFPHRNALLGRVSTDEEIAYLQSSQAFLG